MSDGPKPTRRDGLSRRDFVQGRFWRAVVSKLGPLAPASDVEGPSLDSKRPEESGISLRDITADRSDFAERNTTMMRYPKSLHEVAASDPPDNARQQVAAAPLPANTLRRRTIPVLRPPGAIDEEGFLAGCTRCDRCIQACPHDAIIHAPVRLREAAGTPIIDPDRQPCMMCENLPCIAACEPSVLNLLIPEMMGTAKVTEHLCLAHHGTTCTVCSERCPVESAIDVIEGKPTVNETTCTGCGVCRYVCPAPENAILLMPTYLRPSPTRRPSR